MLFQDVFLIYVNCKYVLYNMFLKYFYIELLVYLYFGI